MNSKIRKIISAILAALMLLTTGIVFGRSPRVEAGDIVLQQCDPQWKSYPYGDGTLGNSGCGAFAIINAVRYLTGNTMDIYAVADWGTANEYINGVGSSFTIAPNAAAKFGSTYGFQLDTHYGFNGYVGNCYPATPAAYDAAWNTLVSKLSKGEVAVGLVHNHFISIVDYDSATNRVLVYDPGAGTKRQTTKSGDWKTYDELNYWSEEGTTYLKLRAYLTFYFATGVTAPASTSTTPAFSGSADAAGEYIVTTGGGELNLRGAASTSSAILTKIPNGASVQVIESDGSWASVLYNGVSGYCSMQYLTAASKATTTASVTGTASGTTSVSVTGTTVSASSASVSSSTTAQLSEEKAGAYVVSANGSYLNMRSGAGTSYSIVAQIPDKSEVTVTAANDEWAAVTWKGNSGYCSMAYLKKTDETTSSASQTTVSSTTTTTTTTTATAATTAAASTTTTTSEVSVSATESSSESATSTTELTSVTTETTEASNNSEPSDNSAEAGAYLVATDGAHLNLRQSGSLGAKILAQIPNESEVFVISTDGEWSNVSWNGIVGYCKAEYLTKKIIEADQSSDSISDISPAYVTLYGDVNLDGNIDMSDVVLLHKALTGAISLNKTSAANSDCYLDGTLSMVDATVIIQYVIDNCAIPIKPVV
ncbi:MAG: SH3 domain-containing protein [Ruminococcus sp.]